MMSVHAVDADAGRNQAVTYYFTEQTKADQFSIDNISGDVTVIGQLDYEKKRSFTMFIVAKVTLPTTKLLFCFPCVSYLNLC